MAIDDEAERAIERLVAAEDAAAAAREAVNSARSDLDSHMARIRTEALEAGEVPLTTAEVRRLYRDVPCVRASTIGIALGVSGSEVYRFARLVDPQHCPDCGKQTGEVYVSNASPEGRPGRRCDECEQMHSAQERSAEAERQMRRASAEQRRRERLMEGDCWVTADEEVVRRSDHLGHRKPYPEVDECTTNMLLVSEEAWRDGGRAVYWCPECHEITTVNLVRYLPPVRDRSH